MLLSIFVLINLYTLPKDRIEHFISTHEKAISKKNKIIKKLRKTKQKDLVFVTHNPNSSPGIQWVMNSNDIFSQEVIWARDLGVKKNKELIKSLPKVKIWKIINPLEPLLEKY